MLLRPLLISLFMHGLLIAVFIYFSQGKTVKKISLEASLVITNKKISKEKDLLPKKITQAKANVKPLAIKPITKTKNFLNDLEALSKSFEQDIKNQEDKSVQEQEVEFTYFDEIYANIKNSFTIPPQMDTPKAAKLKTIIKLYIDEEGKVINIELHKTSSDNYFDELVMAAVKKIHKFNSPPLHLQESLKYAGVVIELCPKDCVD